MSDVDFSQWSVKHRPRTLEGYIGSESTKSDARAIVANRNHAVLFHGDSGCGKTTLARITANGLTTNPADIVEKNIGADRSIEMIRGLVESATFMPRGGCKVYILDEAHALLGPSQSAILKFLEEPPHTQVCVMLCTDRPWTLDKQLLNRCRKVEIKLPDELDLARLLYRVMRVEKAFPALDETQRKRLAREVARAADRVPREALQLLETVHGRAETFTTFKDLVINGVRAAADDTVYKVALKIMLAWYSTDPAMPLAGRAKFLASSIADKDAYGVLKALTSVHYETMMSVAGVTSNSGGYYTRELSGKDAIPTLAQAVDVGARLSVMSNAILQSNMNLNHYLHTELLRVLVEIAPQRMRAHG